MSKPITAPRLLASLALLFITLAFPVMAAGGNPDRPQMKLRVSTHHGYQPLDLKLEGTIQAADPASFNACLLTVERNYTTPGGQPLVSKVEIPCIDPPTDARLPESFKKRVTLEEPGTYSYRIVVLSTEGKRYASTSQEVQVIKSPVEVGAAATRRDGP